MLSGAKRPLYLYTIDVDPASLKIFDPPLEVLQR